MPDRISLPAPYHWRASAAQTALVSHETDGDLGRVSYVHHPDGDGWAADYGAKVLDRTRLGIFRTRRAAGLYLIAHHERDPSLCSA